MKLPKQFLIAVGCILLAAIAWITLTTRKTDEELQTQYLEEAGCFLKDDVYIRAVPLLEKAAAYDASGREEAEQLLKDAYLQLVSDSSYQKKYTDLLDIQMSRENAPASVFEEAANYYFAGNNATKAYEILRNGIKKTGDQSLHELYENTRYVFSYKTRLYRDASEIYGGAVSVQDVSGLWGIANRSGDMILDCVYEKISSYDGQFVVMNDGVISAISEQGFRLALCSEMATDFSNLGESRIGLKTPDGWRVADQDFNLAPICLEAIGMYQNGCAPAKLNGKWGLLKADAETWMLEPKYDEILQDNLGRAFSQNCVFCRENGTVRLLSVGGQHSDTYEDAKPFADGWAAVKNNGKWGFIDTEGTLMIDYQFDDARSFSGHLAAVKCGEVWGYVSLEGKVVIAPAYEDVKNFSDGAALVKTEDGWRFLILQEYK